MTLTYIPGSAHPRSVFDRVTITPTHDRFEYMATWYYTDKPSISAYISAERIEDCIKMNFWAPVDKWLMLPEGF